MAESDLEGLFASLDAGFEGASARADEEAANDLAFSLAQDESATRILGRSGHHLLMADGARGPIMIVGRDYVIGGPSGDLVIPLERCVAVANAEASLPEIRDSDLTALLRSAARNGATVEIDVGCIVLTGRVRAASPEHMVIEARQGRLCLGRAAVQRLRLLNSGSADAP